jgi:hypothetical protein
MIFEFETRSTASQFMDLENLIGSLHTYVLTEGHLIVRNMGLTNGQQKLLKRYENVQIISSTFPESENIRTINVHHELILINNTLYDRDNQGKYNYINSIRKQFYLAVVIPFIDTQLNQIINQLNMNEFYSPCQNRSNSIDLIFYHNKKNISSLEKNLSQLNYLKQCYRDIYYIAADLSEKENRYPIGSANMWKKLFINEQFNTVSLRSRGYTHFFLMEPDTRPIRSYWLDAIVEKITNGHSRESYISTKWWITGSIYRGSEPIGNDFLHINGNALYHLSLDFVSFIENVSHEYPYHSDKSMGYDLDLFLYLFQHIDIAKNVWHKFQFTDLIQNCWHTSCNDTDMEFLNNNPSTYLIHGYKIQQSQRKSTSHRLYYIVLIMLFLIILGQFRCYRRRLCCTLNVIIETYKRKSLFVR